MIPDFNTYIKESHWSEMNRRSQGIKVRKEDDIDNLTMEEFCEYLNSHYTYIGRGISHDIEYHNGRRNIIKPSISFPVNMWYNIPELVCLDYKEAENRYVVRPDFDLFNNHPDLLLTLAKKYNIKKHTNSFNQIHTEIEPYKGVVDYKFFIQVIDDVLKNVNMPLFRKNVNESHWSEMNRRSQGITRRKEDSVNLLKPKEFVDYMNNRYSFKLSKIFFGEILNTMFIPISQHGKDNRNIGAAYVPDTSEIESIWIDNHIADESPELYDQINSKFKITIKNKNTPMWGYFELPEGEELFSNLFLIKILDYIASLDTSKKNIKRK